MHFRSMIRLHRNVAFRYIDEVFFFVAVEYIICSVTDYVAIVLVYGFYSFIL